MLKSARTVSSFALAALLFAAPSAKAATMVDFAGNANGSLATGTASITLAGNVLTGTLTNTSPFDARVMGFGFDVGATNLNGFTGTANAGFTFSDGNVGTVPQFSGATIDFVFAVNCVDPPGNPGQQCDLNGGGSPNNGLDFGQTVNFSATNPAGFGGLNEAQIAAALFVRFQRVGANGNLSDVSSGGSITTTNTTTQITAVPEPATMLLLGTGLLAAARARRRKTT